MTTSTESADVSSSQSESTPSGLLDNLIDTLVHQSYHTSDWLDAISERIADPELAIGKIGQLIRLSAKVGVLEATTRKLVVAIVENDELDWKDEQIDFLVTGIYKQHQEQEETDRRRRTGLPPLK